MNPELRKLIDERLGKNVRDIRVTETGAIVVRLNTPQQRTGEKGTVFAIEISNDVRTERGAKSRAASGDGEKTVTFSFSSEAGVPNWWGDPEILSHHQDDADFSRLREVGAILKNHNPSMITGKPLEVWIDEGTRKGCCTEEFGTTDIAETARREVLIDKSLRGISVGFIVREWVILENSQTSYRGIKGSDEQTVWVASKWEAMEASHTPIPADPTVGVGRSVARLGTGGHREQQVKTEPSADEKRKLEQQEKRKMNDLEKRALAVGLRKDASEEAVREAELAKAREEGASKARETADQEMTRQRDIRELAEAHEGKISDIGVRCKKAIDGKVSVGDFRSEILDCYTTGKAIVRSAPSGRRSGSDSQPDMSQFRLSRFLLGVMDGGLTGLEREVHEEGQREADALGLGVGSGYMPSSIIRELGVRAEMHRTGKTRASVVGTEATGGYLVGTENMGLIEALKPRLWMNELGVKMLTGLRNNITLPGISAEGAAEDLTEVESMSGADITLDQRTLSPDRVGTQVTFGLMLLRQSSPQIEQVLSDILYSRIATKYNAKAIAFIRALVGVNAVTTSGATLSREIMRQFKTLVAADNADAVPPAFMFNSTVEGKLDSIKVDAGSGLYLYSEKENGEGRVLNRRALTTNLMADTDIFYGDFTKLWMGDWGGIDFVRDNVTQAAKGEIVLTANSFIDFAVEHEEHFARATDVNPAA